MSEHMEERELTELIQAKLAAGEDSSGWVLALVGMRIERELKALNSTVRLGLKMLAGSAELSRLANPELSRFLEGVRSNEDNHD